MSTRDDLSGSLVGKLSDFLTERKIWRVEDLCMQWLSRDRDVSVREAEIKAWEKKATELSTLLQSERARLEADMAVIKQELMDAKLLCSKKPFYITPSTTPGFTLPAGGVVSSSNVTGEPGFLPPPTLGVSPTPLEHI